MEEQTLYIFIDESGDFNFSPTGSKYFVLSSMSTLTPLSGLDSLAKLRYELMSNGKGREYFHATEDLQEIRNKVFEIVKQIPDFKIDSVIAEKI